MFGLSCLGSIFSLLAVDNTHLGLPSPLQSLAKTELVVPVPGRSHPGSSSPLQSFACFGLVLLASSFTHVDSSLFLHRFACMNPALSAVGVACSGFVTPVLSSAQLASSVSARSLGHSESSTSVLLETHLELLLLLHTYQCIDPAASASGLVRVGFVFLLSVIDWTRFGSSMSLRSYSCLGPCIPMLDYVTMASILFVRSLGCMGLSTLAFERSHNLGFLPFLQSFGCVELLLLVLGPSRPDLLPSSAAFATMGFSLFLRHSLRMGLATLVLDPSGVDLFLLLRGVMKADSALPVLGISRPGFCFCVSVTDATHLGSSSPAQSYAHLAPMLLAVDSNHIDFFLSARCLVCVGDDLSIFGLA